MNIRHNIRLAAVLAATVLAAGCGKDKMEFEPVPVPTDEKGFLVLAGMNVGITTEVETLENGDLAAQAATRAATEADGAYLVQINSTTATQEVAWSGSYADIKAMTEPLSLAPGRYTIAAQSPEEIPDAAWETPRYAGSTECSIIKKQTTTVNDLTCRLSNIKTTVELSADLKDLFLNDGIDDLQVAVALGDTRMVFGRDETRAAYFRAPQASNQMTVTLTGRYNVKGEGETPVYQPVTMTQQIGNVRAGQWRKINISIQHADQGNVKFIVTVQTWVYDSPLVVDVMSKDYAVYEEEIPDVDDEVTMPGSPVLLLDCTDHRITDPFRITAASFDFDYTPVRSNHPLKIIGTPQDGTTIADAHCVFGSDNPVGEALTRIRLTAPDALFVQPFGAEDATEFTASRNADGQFRVPVYADTHPAAALENRTLTIDYESQHALLEGRTVVLPHTLRAEAANTVSMTVPYLFEEDFGGVNGSEHNVEAGGASTSASNSATGLGFMGLTDAWSGQRIGSQSGRAVKISSVRGLRQWRGRMTAPPLSGLKADAGEVAVTVEFYIDGYQSKGSTCTCTFGFSDDDANTNLTYDDGLTTRTADFTPPTDGGYDRIATRLSYTTLPGQVNAASRPSWLIDYGSGGGAFDYRTYYLFIDNIRISLGKEIK